MGYISGHNKTPSSDENLRPTYAEWFGEFAMIENQREAEVLEFERNMSDRCPFCEPEKHRIWFYNHLGYVLWDAFPIANGHALVVPKRHVASIYELPLETQALLWQMVTDARQRHKRKEGGPNGFNIGVNDGTSAGQTIGHAHIHIIPRWNNDVPDPRGGMRWVIPEKACYWDDK